MKAVIQWGLFAHVILFLVACASSGDVSTPRPAWIDNPGNGVSAAAGWHTGGRIAQEELAILRGREEYAKRFGVNIQSEQLARTTVANDIANTVAIKTTQEGTNQKNIKVMLKEKWREPGSDMLWVWLVPTDQ